MRLRLQVFVGLALVLALTLFGAWVLAAGMVFRPLVKELDSERVAVAVHFAKLIEQSRHPKRRVDRLATELGVDVRVTRQLPPNALESGRPAQHNGYDALVLRGPGAAVAVAFERYPGDEEWLMVYFQTDLDRPRRQVAVGLMLLAAAAVMLAFVVVRFVFRPLEVATSAMRRVADGELSHRVPEGGAVSDVATTFNTMAGRVEGLVQGQRDLMAAVSHELRTPLTRMRLHLELLPDTPDPAARIDALSRDVTEVDALVGELLESARLHQGVLTLDYAEIDLSELVQSTLASAGLGARTVHVEVSPVVIIADERRLRRCLDNLLSNVARYTPADCTVRVTVQQSDGLTHIEVADNGPGVTAAELQRLFDPFFRAESSRSKSTGGLGIGLMLVRQIAEAHAGTARASSNEDGGLAVVLTLPSEGPQS